MVSRGSCIAVQESRAQPGAGIGVAVSCWREIERHRGNPSSLSFSGRRNQTRMYETEFITSEPVPGVCLPDLPVLLVIELVSDELSIRANGSRASSKNSINKLPQKVTRGDSPWLTLTRYEFDSCCYLCLSSSLLSLSLSLFPSSILLQSVITCRKLVTTSLLSKLVVVHTAPRWKVKFIWSEKRVGGIIIDERYIGCAGSQGNDNYQKKNA